MHTSSTPGAPDLSKLKISDRDRKAGGGNRRAGGGLRWIAVVLVVMLLAAGVYRWRGSKLVVEAAPARSAVDAGPAALLNASGYITPRRRSTIAAKITGRVIEVNVEEGMRVRQGQVLARLDCAEAEAALASAQADRLATQASVQDLEVNLANAERELQRAKELSEAGVSTRQAFDTARTLVDSYRARISLTRQQVAAADRKVDVAQQDVENCTVRAPFEGLVVSKDAQPGEMVSPISAGGGFTRTGIATIVDMLSLEIEVDVNESYIARVKPGQKVMATLDAYPEWKIPSRVRTVIPTADRQKATVKVRISFDQLDPRMLPDMGVKVAFLAEEKPGEAKGPVAKALIPGTAVRQENGQSVVFVIRDDKIERRAVTLGAQRGEEVEVIAGISEADRVVVNGPPELRDGQTVQVKP